MSKKQKAFIPRWDDWPHVLRTQQFSAADLEAIVLHSGRFEKAMLKDKKLPRLSKRRDRIVKIAMYEPSTRTEDTFWVACVKLGFAVRDIPNPNVFSSAVKGESFRDAIAALTRVGGMGEYSSTDCIVIRYKEEGAAARAAKIVDTASGDGHYKRPLPVINAGDGAGQHPTQALDDLCTIYQERKCYKHPLKNLTLLLPGQVIGSRSTNSLLYLLGKFGEQYKINVIFSTPDKLGPDVDMLEYLARHQIRYEFEPNFERAIPHADVIYMTRIQRERIEGEPISFEERSRFVFRKEYLAILKKDAFVMHPLPVNRDPKDPPEEIDDELTSLALVGDPRLAWFRQSHRHIATRAALLDLIFAGIDAKWTRTL